MRLRALLVIFATLCVSVLMSSAARAACLITPFTFYATQNDSVATSVVITNGSSCILRFVSHNTLVFESVSVASPPNVGTASSAGTFEIRYKPKAGFKGSDRLSLKVCGKGRTGQGCSTITYNFSIN